MSTIGGMMKIWKNPWLLVGLWEILDKIYEFTAWREVL